MFITNKRLNFQNILRAHTSKQQKDKHHYQRTGRRPKQTPLQTIYTYNQQAQEKMLNIGFLEKHKSTLRYHFIPVRMAIIKKPTKINTNVGEGLEKRNVQCWQEYKLVQPLRKTIQKFLKNLTELPYDPAILLLGRYLEKTIN